MQNLLHQHQLIVAVAADVRLVDGFVTFVDVHGFRGNPVALRIAQPVNGLGADHRNLLKRKILSKVGGVSGFRRGLRHGFFDLHGGHSLLRLLFQRRGHQTQPHKGDGDDPGQTDPEAGSSVAEDGLDAVADADLPKGNGTGGVVHPVGGAFQQRLGIGLPLRKGKKLHHPFVAGHLNILAKQHIGQPHQRIEPVHRQSQIAHQLEPVIPLFQMGALVSQNEVPGLRAHPGGDVNPGLQKAQNKGGFDLIALPVVEALHRKPHPVFQPEVGCQGVHPEACRHRQPHNSRQSFIVPLRLFRGIRLHRGNLGLQCRLCRGWLFRIPENRGSVLLLLLKLRHGHRFGLDADRAADFHRHQEPGKGQQPQQTQKFSGGLFQQRPQQHHCRNHQTAMDTGRNHMRQQLYHGSSS